MYTVTIQGLNGIYKLKFNHEPTDNEVQAELTNHYDTIVKGEWTCN